MSARSWVDSSLAKYRKKQSTWPDETEEIIDSVVKSMADDIEFIIDSFMPDGRRFREKSLSEDEQLEMYLNEGLHDNTAACENWIRTRVVQLTQELQKYGVPPEMVAQAHPYDRVQTAAFKFSAKMEKLLEERNGGAGAAVAPPIPMNPNGDGNWQIPATKPLATPAL